MGLLKWLLIINFMSIFAYGSAEVGLTPSLDTSGRKTNKFYMNTYDKITQNYYLNLYLEYEENPQYGQIYQKVDFNKHINDFVIGVGFSNTKNGFFNKEEIRANFILKLW